MDPLLARLHADRYVVYGVVTEICVRFAAFGLLKTGKPVEIVTDAVQALDEQKAREMFSEFRRPEDASQRPRRFSAPSNRYKRCWRVTCMFTPAMKKARIVFCFLLMSLGAFAQILPSASKPASPPQNKDPLDRDSPQSSVVEFLEAAHAQNYSRAWRYLDLRSMPQDQRLADGTQLVRELQTILDRDTQFDVGNLSRSPEGDQSDNLPPNIDRVDTFHVNGKTLELDLERVTLHSGLRVWLFSSDSVVQNPADCPDDR